MSPSSALGLPGIQQQFLFHYTNPNGPSDIAYGQVLFNTNPNGPDGNGACQVEWDSGGALNLVSPTANIDGYSTTAPSPLSNAYCTVDSLSSRLTQTASGYDLTLAVSFTSQFSQQTASGQIYAYGENMEGLQTAWANFGTFAQNPMAFTAQQPSSATTAVTVLNNGVMQNFPYGSCDLYSNCLYTSCSTTYQNVTAQATNLTVSSFTVSVTATPRAIPGLGTIQCTNPTTSNYYLSIPLTIDDASPQIIYVQQYAPNPDGSFYATLWGANFGPTLGGLGVCAAWAPDPCNGSPDLVVTLNAPYGFWSDTQINALFIPFPNAAGQQYDVQVTSLGENGTAFVPQPGKSQSQSNRGQVNVPQGTPTAAVKQGSTTVSGKPATNPTVVSVGQQIVLTATVANLPTSLQVQKHAWSIDGSPITAYSQSVQQANAPTPFADPGMPQVTFYWIAGSGSGNYNVTYTATLSDNSQVTASAPFLVVRPSPATLKSSTTTASPAINVGAGQFSNGVIGLNFGTSSSPGITFNMTASTGIGGQFALVQLVNFTTTYVVNGVSQPHTSSGSFVLDDGGTGVPQYSGPDSIVTINAGQTGQWPLFDTPAIGLDSALQSVTANQQFQTYLMYQPPGNNSIWVTLQQMSWGWNGGATNTNGTWAVNPGSNFTQNPTGTDSTTLPTWQNYVSNIK